jgi:hypothetical protein
MKPSFDVNAKGDGSNQPIYEEVSQFRYLADHTRPDLLASVSIIIYVDSKSSIAISDSLKTGSNIGHMMMRINYIYHEVLAKTVESEQRLLKPKRRRMLEVFRVLVSRLDLIERVSHYLFEMSINGFPYISLASMFQ